MATSKKKTEVAENGQTQTPVNDVAQILNSVSAWAQKECASDEELEQRISEYFNLCVLKGEMPMFETLCLYLGTSDDTGKGWIAGDGCSSRRSKAMQNALTMLKAAEGKAVYAGKIRDVPYIWRSKQYFGYKEPGTKLEELIAAHPAWTHGGSGKENGYG